MPPSRLSPQDRRAILMQLNRDRLAELTLHFELEVSDRRSASAHIDAIVRKRSLDFRLVLEQLKREELQDICAVMGLGKGGREKAKLVARILGESESAAASAGPADAGGARQPAVEERSSGERASRVASRDSEPPPSVPPPSGRAPATAADGALKSRLRKFVVRTAAEYLGRDAAGAFVSRLLQCFGWPEGGPADAELGATLAVVESGERKARPVALLWKARRVLIDVVKHDVMLDYAWKELLRVCLQADPVPQYVVLTNQRELHLYDLNRERDKPRLAIALDDLPKKSEAFTFLLPQWHPGMVPTIVNESKVSADVANLVARLYRSLKEQHPKREADVVQFTLQCILTMFAEDIGLLPQEHFTTLLYDGARHGDVERRLAELFRLMATRDVPEAARRVVPHFNGGLFTNPVTLPLGEAQLAALTKASEANWRYVDPHIFGSVFQGIMNDDERHRSGAHYTAHEDIMRVVGPTIVEPWRKRIQGATTLAELLEVRKALLAFRVLDPACGSGNFLYVSFRELYKLDTELLARLREFPSTSGGATKIAWGSGIQTSRFFGIDINPFAVELAKVTLNIAKKIAFDERRETAADLFGQVEMDIDPSLPLDNLNENIVCKDALFTEWPEVDAIVGNPPFLGGQKIRKELGVAYVEKLQRGSGVDGIVDLVCYWFRRAHDHLGTGARAGLVATSGIRVGRARETALDYIVKRGGTITNAVSSRLWPGEAAVNVSMVNWMKGPASGPFELIVEDQVYSIPRVASHLQLHSDVSESLPIAANSAGPSLGVIFGHEAFRGGSSGFPRPGGKAVRPVATGDDLMRSRLSTEPDYCIFMGGCATEQEARQYDREAYEHLKEAVYPMVRGRVDSGKETKHYEGWIKRWWQPRWFGSEFFARISGLRRIVVCSKILARPTFCLLSAEFVPNDTLMLFALDDDYSFGLVQSDLHWAWAKAKGSRVTERIQYTGAVWTTFPWPQEPTEAEVVAVAAAGRELRRVRDELTREHGLSLRAMYQAAEGAGPHPLKDAQAALDEAVRRAYSMPTGAEPTEFLLEMNKLVAEDEAEGRQVQGPGLPRGLDPKDPRWTSDDCIQPPKV